MEENDSDEDPVLLEFESVVCGMKGTTTTISVSDMMCLRPDGSINSRILDFWISHLHHVGRIHPKDQERIIVFSSIFYPYLRIYLRKRQGRRRRRRNKPPALGLIWTRWVDDLFLKDFIILPIVLEAHWFLAVVCYPAMVLGMDEDVSQDRSKDKEGRDDLSKLRRLIKRIKGRRAKRDLHPEPVILIFDSLKSYGIYHKSCGSLLRRFLNQEWENRYPGTRLLFTQKNLPLLVLDVPQQNNGSECGLFLLRFFEKFATSPSPRSTTFPVSLNEVWSNGEDDDQDQYYYGMREEIYDKLCELIANERLQDEKANAELIPIIKFPKVKVEEEDFEEDEDDEDLGWDDDDDDDEEYLPPGKIKKY